MFGESSVPNKGPDAGLFNPKPPIRSQNPLLGIFASVTRRNTTLLQEFRPCFANYIRGRTLLGPNTWCGRSNVTYRYGLFSTYRYSPLSITHPSTRASVRSNYLAITGRRVAWSRVVSQVRTAYGLILRAVLFRELVWYVLYNSAVIGPYVGLPVFGYATC